MAGKYALIIGNSDYKDAELRQLIAPPQDAEALARVLLDSSIGGFNEVTPLLNATKYEIEKSAEKFFARRLRNDLLLFYFSGHGVTDDSGSLYFAANNTEFGSWKSTATSASFLKELMLECSARQVIVLDCCFSGAFTKGLLRRGGSAVVDTQAHIGGSGRVILTASNAIQFSFEGNEREGAGFQSFFSRYLVEGLKTGKADRDNDGDVSVNELYEYAYECVIKQTRNQNPRFFADVEGRIILAKNPHLEAERLAKGKIETERLAKDRVEKERIAREKTEADRLAREKAEQQRIAREKTEADRLAREKAEQQRIAREKAEVDRLAREKAEQQRIAREKTEADRLAREKAEQQRIAREKTEADRLAREKAEQQSIAREKAEIDRLAREKAESLRTSALRLIVICTVVVVLGIAIIMLVPQGGASTIFSILALLCNLATLVFFILVLIKMFQKAGALQGILGLICSVWAFIWGWMNLKDEKFQNIPLMWGWTGAIVLGVVFQLLGGMFSS